MRRTLSHPASSNVLPASRRHICPCRQDADSTLSGFTLIELMVVITLIAIMTAMIVPAMKGTYDDALLRSTSRKLVSVFHLAYSQAVAANQLHRVRVDRKNGLCLVEKQSRAEDRTSGFVPVRKLPDGNGRLDARISIQLRRAPGAASESPEQAAPFQAEDSQTETPDEAIAFYPDGTADAMEIVLRDPQGFRLALRVNGTTAHIRVVELERE
jgi:type II secretion system protein H